jgi:MFS family permease
MKKSFFIQAILTASIGGILYGYDMGVVSGALPSLAAYFQLTSIQQEWVVALLYFGGGVGAATGGFICDLFGRKRAILVTDAMFGLGALLLFGAQSVTAIMVGRCVVGWAVAVSAIADVAYLHEISSAWEEDEIALQEGNSNIAANQPRRQNSQHSSVGGRGSVVSVNEACISLGFLMAYGVAYSLGESNNSEEWRSMFGFGGILAIIQFVGMLFMPESPVWLHNQGRFPEANASRNKIRGLSQSHASNSNVEVEMHSSPPSSSTQTSTFTAEDFMQTTSSNCIANLAFRLCSIPRIVKRHCKQLTREMFVPYKQQCTISLFLAMSQQFCGHPSVLNFSAEIFSVLNGSIIDGGAEEENIASFSPVELTVGIGILKFLTTIVVILFVERVGRRPLLLSGMVVICISLTFLIVAFSGYGEVDIQQQQQQQFESISSSVKSNIGIIGIYGVAVGYAMSYGPLNWLITSELFPSLIRGRALGFATVITYVAAGIVSRTFLSLQSDIGLSKCFSLYWLATMISIVFVWLGVPETGNGRTVDEISGDFTSMWVWGGRRSVTGFDSSWRAARSYGSWGLSPDCNNNIDGLSPTASIEEAVTVTDTGNGAVVGLSPRRSSSSRQVV